MRVVVAPDKFKGSLDAGGVAEAIGRGIADVRPDATVELVPIADGGEGTAEVICRARGAEWMRCTVQDPFGRAIEARYCWLNGGTAVMEMSEAAGMRRVSERDPLRASSYGVGEMIADATQRGAREIVIGLGGSATNDGGFGMARALGFRFFAGERELINGPAELIDLMMIDRPNELRLPPIVAAVDVRNPLLGERGATRIFGPQKGVTREQIPALERGLTVLADVAAREMGSDFRAITGAGAAGGLGFALVTFCGAIIRSGFDVVAEAIGLEEKVRAADVVITGEGRLDVQTAEGKGPAGVARLARKFGRPVFAIVGETVGDAGKLFDGVYSLVLPPTISREAAISRCAALLRERAGELAKTL